jgi:hypothetical protein
MNTYISELSAMIPTCVAMQRKMDKLTVLRLAGHSTYLSATSVANSWPSFCLAKTKTKIWSLGEKARSCFQVANISTSK